MELKNQVCTLEQAKKLYKLGVKAESYFAWRKTAIDKVPVVISGITELLFDKQFKNEIWAAYSCAELGIMLPTSIGWNPGEVEIGNKALYYNGYKSSEDELSKDNKHEAHAKANLLINLLEGRIINPEDIRL